MLGQPWESPQSAAVHHEQHDGEQWLQDVARDRPGVVRCVVAVADVLHDVPDRVTSVGDGQRDDGGGHPAITEPEAADAEHRQRQITEAHLPLEHARRVADAGGNLGGIRPDVTGNADQSPHAEPDHDPQERELDNAWAGASGGVAVHGDIDDDAHDEDDPGNDEEDHDANDSTGALHSQRCPGRTTTATGGESRSPSQGGTRRNEYLLVTPAPFLGGCAIPVVGVLRPVARFRLTPGASVAAGPALAGRSLLGGLRMT